MGNGGTIYFAVDGTTFKKYVGTRRSRVRAWTVTVEVIFTDLELERRGTDVEELFSSTQKLSVLSRF